MATKQEIAEQICALVGEAAEMLDPGNGWPARIRVSTEDGSHEISAHVGAIGSMHRGPHERRFQNPGQGHPVHALPGTSPILVGLSEEFGAPVLVVPSEDRLGRETRFTVRFTAQLVQGAATSGWAEHVSTSGERFLAFHPSLLPSVIQMRADDLDVAASDVQAAVAGAGVLVDESEDAKERVRRATSSLVRDSRFSKAVRQAYGNRCAMCGLGLGLVVGAHIKPAALPDSPDHVRNGLSLCENHHRAFDRHLIWVDPASRNLRLHPTLQGPDASEADSAFVESTFGGLAPPEIEGASPEAEYFEERYAAFKGAYDWVS